jgi:hypothetical protein
MSGAAAAFDAVARAAAAQLGPDTRRVLRTGDLLQRNALAAISSSGGWMQAASDLVGRPAEAFRFFLPGGEGSVARKELCNKIEVYLLVTGAADRIGIPDPPLPSLATLVDRAFALGPFPALWALEGLGLEYADSRWRQEGDLRSLLAGVPVSSLAMLHAGLGMAVGQRILDPLSGDSPAPEVHRAAREIVTRCREGSQPEYLGAALEAIGLVTRTLHPDLVQRFDEALWGVDREAVSYFWHGVGRAVYFLPVNFLPCGSSPWRAFEMVGEEAPHELARCNAFAGLAWAFVLVNQRHPEIVADLLREHGAQLASEAFADGAAGAVLLRYATTPDAPFLAAFCEYRPDASDAAWTARWDELVRTPCQEALQRSVPALRKTGLGAIFHYRGKASGTLT